MNSSKSKGVYKIPAELLADFMTLPNSTGSGKKINWTQEQDSLILNMWPIKKHSEFVKKFIDKYGFGSRTSIIERYRTLKPNGIDPDEYNLLRFPE